MEAFRTFLLETQVIKPSNPNWLDTAFNDMLVRWFKNFHQFPLEVYSDREFLRWLRDHPDKIAVKFDALEILNNILMPKMGAPVIEIMLKSLPFETEHGTLTYFDVLINGTNLIDISESLSSFSCFWYNVNHLSSKYSSLITVREKDMLTSLFFDVWSEDPARVTRALKQGVADRLLDADLQRLLVKRRAIPFISQLDHYLRLKMRLRQPLLIKQILRVMDFSNATAANWSSLVRFLRVVSTQDLLYIGKERITALLAMSPAALQAHFFPPQASYDATSEPCLQAVDIQKAIRSLHLPEFPLQFFCIAICDVANGRRCPRFRAPKKKFCAFHLAHPTFRTFVDVHNSGQCRSDTTSGEYRSVPQDDDNSLLRYSSTKRPVNPMSHLLPFVTDAERLRDGFYLPVVRYEGLYYSKKDANSVIGNPEIEQVKGQKTLFGFVQKNAVFESVPQSVSSQQRFCGKFFFYEPNSSQFLFLGKSAFFATKVDAYMRLENEYRRKIERPNHLPSADRERRRAPTSARTRGLYGLWFSFFHPSRSRFLRYKGQRLSQYPLEGEIEEFDELFGRFFRIVARQIGENAMNHPFLDEWLQFHFATILESWESSVGATYDVGLPLFYPSVNPEQLSGGMGSFDFLDQPICTMARVLGFNTVVLQHEIGGYDVVTEILHTGKEFKQDLVRISHVHDSMPKKRRISPLPKIWFPRNDGVLFVSKEGKSRVLIETGFEPSTQTAEQKLPFRSLYDIFDPELTTHRNIAKGSLRHAGNYQFVRVRDSIVPKNVSDQEDLSTEEEEPTDDPDVSQEANQSSNESNSSSDESGSFLNEDEDREKDTNDDFFSKEEGQEENIRHEDGETEEDEEVEKGDERSELD